MDVKALLSLLHADDPTIMWSWILAACTLFTAWVNLRAAYATRTTGRFVSGVPGITALIGMLPATRAIMHFLDLPLWAALVILPLSFLMILLIQGGLLYLTDLVCTLLGYPEFVHPDE